MRHHAVQREVAIKAQYLSEKRRLNDDILELRRAILMVGGYTPQASRQCEEGMRQMSALKARERNEVGQAWKIYDDLW